MQDCESKARFENNKTLSQGNKYTKKGENIEAAICPSCKSSKQMTEVDLTDYEILVLSKDTELMTTKPFHFLFQNYYENISYDWIIFHLYFM